MYGSSETHSSIDKAIKIAGFGQENLVKVEGDDALAMKPEALKGAILADREAGFQPLAVVATIGTTSTTAVDPIAQIADICEELNLWLHIDAAYAGTAMLLPEYQHMLKGIEKADSYVFNPHKWMFTNFDCTAYFVKNPEDLVRTFEILPEYLKTSSRGVKNYRDWGIPLGRRFRALKLWFVIRSFGMEGIRSALRHHIALANKLKEWVELDPDFELMAPVPFNLVCFRFKPSGVEDEQILEAKNKDLLERLNASGKMYLTHTRIRGPMPCAWSQEIQESRSGM